MVLRNTVTAYSAERPPEVQVWLIANKLHTGMVFPFNWLVESGFIPPENFPKCKFVTFSWGDRTAYMNQRWLRATEIIHAIFLPSPSVMECIPIQYHIPEVSAHQSIWMKSIPREKGPHVAAFLNHSMAFNEKGLPSLRGSSSWGGGYLIDSPHSYYFPRICNVWTGQALEACGLEIQPIFSVHRDLLVLEAESGGFSKIWDGSGLAPEELR